MSRILLSRPSIICSANCGDLSENNFNTLPLTTSAREGEVKSPILTDGDLEQGGVAPLNPQDYDSRKSKSFLPTFFQKSRWAEAQNKNKTSPSPCGRGLGGGVSQSNKDSRDLQKSLDCHELLRNSRNDDNSATCDARQSDSHNDNSRESILAQFQKNTRFLTKSSDFLERKIFVGKCENLTPLPQNTAPHFHTRTNMILYNAMRKLDSLIYALINTLGRDKIAVIIGTTTTGIGENYLSIAQNKAILDSIDMKNLASIEKNLGYFNEKSALCNPAEFLRDYYGLCGLTFGVSTACTSGNKAIIEGARLLNARLCDAVICGGVDSLNHLTLAGFDALDILSPALCAPFSANRDGINIGEGAGIFVMTREDLLDSAFENDFQIALLAHKSNNDAFHITQPSPDFSAQSEILAHCKCENLDYVNLHGTGTIANDAMEANLVASILPNVACSTIKPFIGHTLGAAGAIELGICAEAILESSKNGKSPLPPHIVDNYDSTLPKIALVAQGTKKRVQTALSLSFAFGGDNSAILIGAR